MHLQACEDVIKALQVRKQIILESNIDDWEYTNKLAEFERLFLHIEKTKSESLEAVPDREKMRLLARAEAEEERVRLNEEKVRIKKIKAEESAQEREKAKADREAAKEEEKRKRIHEARYPIDDDDLREELIEESKEKGIELSALLRPLPKPVPVENGQVLADEGALAEFLAIFSEALTSAAVANISDGSRVFRKREQTTALCALSRAIKRRVTRRRDGCWTRGDSITLRQR